MYVLQNVSIAYPPSTDRNPCTFVVCLMELIISLWGDTGITGVRYLDGSYLPGGKFYKGLIATPSFGAVQNGWKIDQMAFVLLSCLGTAFLGHFNAPSFYNELKDKSVKKFNQVVGTSFSITTLVYAALMTFGFGTFGTATLGNIFVNYHKADTLALLCRVAMCVAITFSYPVLFMALKTSISPLLKVDKSDVKKQVRHPTFSVLETAFGVSGLR